MNGQGNKLKKQLAVYAMWIVLVFPVFAGWNGFLYPEFTFGSSVGKAYDADGKERKEISGREFYEKILLAEPEQIRIKSRLLEFFFYFIH